MNPFGAFWKLAGVLGVSWLAVLGSVSTTASFTVNPTNPAAGSPVQFDDTSVGATSWQWNFGDGQVSTVQSPAHTYVGPGAYSVMLRVNGTGGQSQMVQELNVSDTNTLTLLAGAGHGFLVTLEATDPRTGNAGVGVAIPQNDVFGYFTIPALVPTNPGAPIVPEVFVKMLDARAIGQDFWLFWGGLTDLEYTLTIQDMVTGAVKVKHNPVTDSPVCLGADTSGFAVVATPTPTVTGGSPTPSPTPTPTPASQIRVVSVNSDFFRDSASGNNVTTINVGDTIEWQWEASLHSSTSGPCPPCGGDGKWNSQLKGSGKFDFTFTEADRGKTFPYFCLNHLQMMTATVKVNP